MYFHAAYISPKIIDLLKANFDKNIVEALLQNLTTAEISYLTNLKSEKLTVWQTQNDSLCNTLLLLDSYVGNHYWQDLEQEITEVLNETFADFWKNDNTTVAQTLFNALHLIEPRLNAISAAASYKESWEKLGSRFEEDFIHKDLSLAAGDFWIQLFEQQREFEEMPEKLQKVDYVLEFPYLIDNKKGLWIEVDGEIHETELQKAIDIQRNNFANFNHWLPVWHIKTEDFNMIHRQIVPLQKLMQHDYFRRLSQNYRQTLTNTEIGLDALQILLSPVAIARIHKILIYSLLQGFLNLEHRVWRIAIIEQDIPCGHLAIESFKVLCQKIFVLEGENRSLPDIRLTVITTRKYEYAKLNKNISKNFIVEYVEKPFESQPFDLLIDMSVLQRKGWNLVGNYTILATTKFVIRSSFRTNLTINFTEKEDKSAEKLTNLTNHAINLANFNTFFYKNTHKNNYFTNNLLNILSHNTKILENYYQAILQIPTNLSQNLQANSNNFIDLFHKQYEQIFVPNITNYQIFLQISNTVLLLQLTENHIQTNVKTIALYKIWAAFALFIQVANKSELNTEKLLSLAERQLFEGFYELQLIDFQVFSNFYSDYSAKILQFMKSENQVIIKNVLQKNYDDLQILPHLTWLKEFEKNLCEV
jgi:hypothetical protein